MRKATKIQVVYNDGHVATIISKNERESEVINGIAKAITGSRERHGGLDSLVIAAARSKAEGGMACMVGKDIFLVPVLSKAFSNLVADLPLDSRAAAVLTMMKSVGVAVAEAEDEDEDEDGYEEE